MSKDIYSEQFKSVVAKLKRARLESCLSQAQLAKKLGKTQSYVSKIESGQLRVDVVQLKRVAALYGKKISYFL